MIEMEKDYTNDALDIWRGHKSKSSRGASYEVRVSTQTDSKTGKMRVVITFRNNAFEAIKDFNRAQVSSLEKVRDKIYFGFSRRNSLDCGIAVCFGTNKTSKTVTFLPEPGEILTLEAFYIGREFKLRFDDELGLYYIDAKDPV